MIRKVIIFIIIALLAVAIYTRKEGDFIDYGFKKVVSVFQSGGDYVKNNLIDGITEKVKGLFQEKKEAIDEEIRSEAEKMQEEVKQKGRGLWDRIGDFIFRRGESD